MQPEILTKTEQEIIRGLSNNPKRLNSKFLYDAEGSWLFSKIMRMPEYYVTDVENEIMENSSLEILHDFIGKSGYFEVVELGAGDGLKTKKILQKIINSGIDFAYKPIDISSDAVTNLLNDLAGHFPEIEIEGLSGDYFEMLDYLNHQSETSRLYLFLGSTVGNFGYQHTIDFFTRLRELMKKNDGLLVGFDLKKDPDIILEAYNDHRGITRDFNLNLLKRFNREYEANFNLSRFSHFAEYDPLKGAAKSFLISREEQVVNFNAIGEIFTFDKWEPIYTEISQKYDLEMINHYAENSGFKVKRNFFDQRRYFADSLWMPD